MENVRFHSFFFLISCTDHPAALVSYHYYIHYYDIIKKRKKKTQDLIFRIISAHYLDQGF